MSLCKERISGAYLGKKHVARWVLANSEEIRVLVVALLPIMERDHALSAQVWKKKWERLLHTWRVSTSVFQLWKIMCAVLGSILPPSFGKNSCWPIWKLWLLIMERGRRFVLPLLNGLIASHVCLFLVFLVSHELDPIWNKLCLAANLKHTWRACSVHVFRCSRSSIFGVILSLRKTCVCSVLPWKEACLSDVHGKYFYIAKLTHG